MTPSGKGCLETASLHLLDDLTERSWAADVYLAGSAALALHLAHRRIRDLDIMGNVTRLRAPERRDLLGEILDIRPRTKVETARDGFLSLRVGECALRFYYYPYPLVDPLEEHRGFPFASAVDLGLMKLGALISRGSRRDFVDIFLLTRRVPLQLLLDRSKEKFGHVTDFPLQAFKALCDLSLARDEPMPHLELTLDWTEVEAWIRHEVRALAREYVGLSPVSTHGRNGS